MEKEIIVISLALELELFTDWLLEKDLQCDSEIIPLYLKERTEFAIKQKERYGFLYAQIIP